MMLIVGASDALFVGIAPLDPPEPLDPKIPVADGGRTLSALPRLVFM
jgi:hypothetical protein